MLTFGCFSGATVLPFPRLGEVVVHHVPITRTVTKKKTSLLVLTQIISIIIIIIYLFFLFFFF